MSEAKTNNSNDDSRPDFVPYNGDIIFLDPEELLDEEESDVPLESEYSEPAAVESFPDPSSAGERGSIPLTTNSRADLESITNDVESISGYVIKKKEETRGILALTYLRATFAIFFMGFFIAILDGIINKTSIVTNVEKILPLISGIFLGTLGFVIGYYFRKDEEENSSSSK